RNGSESKRRQATTLRPRDRGAFLLRALHASEVSACYLKGQRSQTAFLALAWPRGEGGCCCNARMAGESLRLAVDLVRHRNRCRCNARMAGESLRQRKRMRIGILFPSLQRPKCRIASLRIVRFMSSTPKQLQ